MSHLQQLNFSVYEQADHRLRTPSLGPLIAIIAAAKAMPGAKGGHNPKGGIILPLSYLCLSFVESTLDT